MAEENKIYGIAWFLAGLGVGALVGILYAPKSGRETREDLITGAKEGTEYLRTRTRQAAEQVGGLVDRSKEQVGEYVERGREVVDRGRAQWEEFVERGKNLVSEQGTRVTAAVDAGRQAYKTAVVPGEPSELLGFFSEGRGLERSPNWYVPNPVLQGGVLIWKAPPSAALHRARESGSRSSPAKLEPGRGVCSQIHFGARHTQVSARADAGSRGMLKAVSRSARTVSHPSSQQGCARLHPCQRSIMTLYCLPLLP